MLQVKDIKPDKLVRLTHPDGQFEGWVRLIQPESAVQTYIKNDDTVVWGKQRWLVRWQDANQIRDLLSVPEYFTQSNQKGRTHRQIHFFIGSKRKLEETDVVDTNADLIFKPLDDFGGAF